MNKKIIEIRMNDVVYIDMDGVLVQSGESPEEWANLRLKPGFFLTKLPVENAIKAFELLSQKCHVYILSTPVWDNVSCWSEKRKWVEKHLGKIAEKKLILTHNKALNRGAFLIDDSLNHGADQFEGIHIHFGTKEFPNWKEVLQQIKFI